MGTLRTKIDVTYKRGIQFKQFEPITVGLTTTLENPQGISDEEMKAEERSLQEYVDCVIVDLLKNR